MKIFFRAVIFWGIGALAWAEFPPIECSFYRGMTKKEKVHFKTSRFDQNPKLTRIVPLSRDIFYSLGGSNQERWDTTVTEGLRYKMTLYRKKKNPQEGELQYDVLASADIPYPLRTVDLNLYSFEVNISVHCQTAF